MLYLCDRFKECRFSVSCGKDCFLTENKAHEFVPKDGATVECINLQQRNEYEDIVRQTNLCYYINGFNITFVEN